MEGVGKMCFFNGKLVVFRKGREIRPWLLITNRKWHTLFQTKLKLSTLDDHEGH